MEPNKELKLIKKYYGEKFMHLCREIFPTILESDGQLFKILYRTIAPTKMLYDDVARDVETFKDYIFSLSGLYKQKMLINKHKSPEELMDEAGYVLYPECKTEEDIQEFKKFYARGEELCTFQGDRLKYCRVWFAVRKDVDSINRNDFKNPMRQDRYGTSVISLQFSKAEFSDLSIKNRYNHTVPNPDATFGNFLDNIIEGLTCAFMDTYGIQLKTETFPQKLEMQNYVMDKNGRYHRYNLQVGNTYFCDGNKVIDDCEVKTLSKDRFILMENYVVDLRAKTIKTYSPFYNPDSFVLSLGEIEDIRVVSEGVKFKTLFITPSEGETIEIALDTQNQIVKYVNLNVKKILFDFLPYNTQLREFIAPNVEKISDKCLPNNKALESLALDKVEKIGDDFLKNNKNLTNLSLPSVVKIGDSCLFSNYILSTLNVPNLEYLGTESFYCNTHLTQLVLPKLKAIKKYCFCENDSLEKIIAPKLLKIGKEFLIMNNSLKVLYAPLLKRMDFCTLYNNSTLEVIFADNLRYIGKDVLHFNSKYKICGTSKLENEIVEEN